jgi:hypothetical protein
LQKLRLIFPAIFLFIAALACSADDVIGQRQQLPTPSPVAFSTATPGGRISVYLGTPNAANPPNAITTPQGGQIVAPAATATAGAAARSAATATAAAAAIVPLFQPNECPSPGAPQSPRRPTAFGIFPQAIALFLSAGGAPTALETTLRAWGTIVEGRGVVQADTDLTGDGIHEIIVTLVDPVLYRANLPAPGQLLIFGCDQKAYKLLYSTPYSPNTILPELRRVGNMNGDGRAQIAFVQQICNAGICTQSMQILNWNTVIGAFGTLNDTLIDATNARVQIADVDGDGILEVTVTFNPPADLNAGPYRRTVHLWDWTGAAYTLAVIQKDAPTYRIHAIYDADAIFRSGDFRGAVRAYDRAKDDANLAAWSPNDPLILRALANYRKLTAYAALRQTKALNDLVTVMQAENPPGSASDVWGQLATAFGEAYKANRQMKRMCTAVQTFITSRPDLLNTINIYGAANHNYTAAELCPF